jgi:hypothetical protein
MAVPRVTGHASLDPLPGFRDAFEGWVMAHRHRVAENHLEMRYILHVQCSETEARSIGRQGCHFK